MKMTQIRQNQLRRKLQDSRSRLMETYPFFAILLMYLRFVAVKNIRNISTNGRCIFFNPDYVSKLYPNELDFILCHQLMHIINGDIFRSKEYKGDDFHRACDIFNNDQLIGIGFKVSSFTHFGKLQYKIPMYDVKIDKFTPYEIYEILPYKLQYLDEQTKRRYMADTDFYWDYKSSDYWDSIIILDLPEMTKFVDELETPEDKKENASGTGATGKTKKQGNRGEQGNQGEELEDFWTHQVGKTVAMVKGMGQKAGTLPGGVRRKIEKGKKRVVNWRKVLNEFLQEEITDYSFTPPDRRYTEQPFFLPDFNEKDYTPKDILFMADASGSVDEEDLSRVYEEISGAIEQFGGKLNGKLGFFDVEVTEPVPFESVEDVRAIAPYGGGGTSFEVIFEYIREHAHEYLPAMIVIFTDGYARFPIEEAAMNIPVLWLISNEDITPPWGRVARII